MFSLNVFSFDAHRFVAPVRGLYWFTLSARTDQDSYASVLIRMNADPIPKARCHDYDGDAVSAILMLEAGDWMDCVLELEGHVLQMADPWTSNIFGPGSCTHNYKFY